MHRTFLFTFIFIRLCVSAAADVERIPTNNGYEILVHYQDNPDSENKLVVQKNGNVIEAWSFVREPYIEKYDDRVLIGFPIGTNYRYLFFLDTASDNLSDGYDDIIGYDSNLGIAVRFDSIHSRLVIMDWDMNIIRSFEIAVNDAEFGIENFMSVKIAKDYLTVSYWGVNWEDKEERIYMSDFDAKIKEQNDPDFPFDLYDGEYPCVQVVAGEIFEIYEPIFEEFDIYGNGPGWDGLIEQALAKIDPEILGRIDFNSEGDCCVIDIDSAEVGRKLIDELKDTFNNEKKLRSFLGTVDADFPDS